MNINIVCPYCLKVNRIPKKESYTKANCGACKKSLLESKPVNVDVQKFSTFLTNSDLPLIVDFWAPWCGPCLKMAPSFEKTALALPLKAQFLKVNTEELQDLGGKYGIQSIPTMIVFKNGKEIDRVSGALAPEQLFSWAKRYI